MWCICNSSTRRWRQEDQLTTGQPGLERSTASNKTETRASGGRGRQQAHLINAVRSTHTGQCLLQRLDITTCQAHRKQVHPTRQRRALIISLHPPVKKTKARKASALRDSGWVDLENLVPEARPEYSTEGRQVTAQAGLPGDPTLSSQEAGKRM